MTIMIGGLFWAIQPIIFTWDSPGYLEGARFFIHAPDGKFPYWRTPLFGMLTAATGGAELRTFSALLAIQFAFGIAMPVLVYFSVSWIETRMAAGVAVLFAATMLPFLLIGVVMPWQLFYFLYVLAIFFACRFIGMERTFDIYASALTAFLAIMARPQGSYVFLILLAIELVAAPRRWRHCVGAGFLVFALQFAYMAARPYFAGPIAPTGEVLLSDLKQNVLIPDDQALYRRAMLFVRENRFDDAEVIARFIGDRSLKQQTELAEILQSLLNREPGRARAAAIASNEPELRDQALFYIAWESKAAGDGAAAQDLHDRIGDAALRTRLEQVWNRPPEIPILTAAAPADSRIEPRPYVTGLDLTNTSGKMLLFPALVTRDLDPGALIVPANGPATAELYRILENYVGAKVVASALYPRIRQLLPDADDILTDPNRIVDALVNKFPKPEAHWTLWATLDRLVGPVQSDRLLRSVYFEFAARHPLPLAKTYVAMAIQSLLWYPILPSLTIVVSFPIQIENIATVPALRREIANSRGFENLYFEASAVYAAFFLWLTRALVVIAPLGIFLIRERRVFLVWALCSMVALEQLAVYSLTAGGGNIVYAGSITICVTMAAGIVLYAGIARCLQRSLVATGVDRRPLPGGRR